MCPRKENGKRYYKIATGWRHGSSSRALAWQAQSHEFKPSTAKKKKSYKM
jgi:hypothetical protein